MIKQQHSSAFQLRNPYRLDRPPFCAADLYDNQDLRELIDLDLLHNHLSPRSLQDSPQLQQLQQNIHRHHRYGRPLPPQPVNSDQNRDLKSTNSQESQRLISKTSAGVYQKSDHSQFDLQLVKDDVQREDRETVHDQQQQQQPPQRSRNRVTGAMKRLRRSSGISKKDQSRLKGSGLVGPRPLVDPVAATADHPNGDGLASPPPTPPIPSITITHHIDSHDELTFERHVEWLTQTALWWDMPVVHLYPAPTNKASIDYVETAASRFSSWVNFVKIDARYGDGGSSGSSLGQQPSQPVHHHHHHNAGLRLSYSKLPQKEEQEHQPLIRLPSVEEGGLVGSSQQNQSSQYVHQNEAALKIDPIIGYVFVGSQDEQTQYQQVFDAMEVLFPMIEIRYINSFDSSQPQRYTDSCLQSLGWIHYWSAAKESQVLQSKIVNEIVRVRPMWVDPSYLHRNFVPMPSFVASEDEQASGFIDETAFVHTQDEESIFNGQESSDQGQLVSSVSISSMVSDMCLDDDIGGISTRISNHSDSDLLFAQRLCQPNDMDCHNDETECSVDTFFDQPLLNHHRRHTLFLTRSHSFGEFELPPLSLEDDDMEDAFALLLPDQQAPVVSAREQQQEHQQKEQQQNDLENDYVVIEDADAAHLPTGSSKARRLKRPGLRREQSRFRFLGRDRRAVSLPDLTESVPKTTPSLDYRRHRLQEPSEEQVFLATSKAQPSIATSSDPVVSSSLPSSPLAAGDQDGLLSQSLANGLTAATAATSSTTQTNASLGNKLVGFVQRLAVYRIRGSMMVFDM
ncbi:hypothetical protein BGW41_002734 [Actinomortierella wolfii]|nr:hypothetical protein BGW41_002734 [Actinomortierella wolfii]